MSKLMIFGCSLLFCLLLERCDAMPYQFLPTREGYVPVYIRMGDTPLNEINPDLAVAFHEMGFVNGRQLKSDDGYINGPSQPSELIIPEQAKAVPEQKPIESVQSEQPINHKV